MWSNIKKVIEFVVVAIAAFGVIALISSLQKYHYGTKCAHCTLTKSYEVQYHVWIQWNGKYECSGTIIHDRHILTAAQCVAQSVPNNEYTTKLKVFSLTRTLNKGRSYDVEKIILHPSYDGKNGHRHNIALIRVEIRLTNYQADRLEIPISKKKMRSQEGLDMFVTGYGQVAVKRHYLDYDQHKFHMEIVSMKRCKKLFSDVDLSDKFCAIAASGYEPCMSDIGSPATINKTRLVGIYIGFKKCSNRNAELFIDVASYLDFIRSAIATT